MIFMFRRKGKRIVLFSFKKQSYDGKKARQHIKSILILERIGSANRAVKTKVWPVKRKMSEGLSNLVKAWEN